MRDPRTAPSTALQQGAVILDGDRRVLAFTKGAEALLGWRAEDVQGAPCVAVLACQNDRGEPLCEGCGFSVAMEQHKTLPATVMQMAHSSGRRKPTSTTFWYLPPAGRIWVPRVMAVIQAAPEGPPLEA